MATIASTARAGAGSPASQAYQILHVGFTVAPIVAGLDKFLGLLTNWDQYLAPVVAGLLPFGGHTFMLIVGAIEIVAGIGVFLMPRVFAYVVSAWLVGIILNLRTVCPALLGAIRTQDMYLAGGIVMILSALTLIGSLISDLVLAWLDPRIRYS